MATGTGFAHFLPMFRSLKQHGQLNDSILLYGCKTVKEDITISFSHLPINVIRCISRETNVMGSIEGRVTYGLETLEFDPNTTDFYVCGSSAMVANCKALLDKMGRRPLIPQSSSQAAALISHYRSCAKIPFERVIGTWNQLSSQYIERYIRHSGFRFSS